jgi:hypothetical protein
VIGQFEFASPALSRRRPASDSGGNYATENGTLSGNSPVLKRWPRFVSVSEDEKKRRP